MLIDIRLVGYLQRTGLANQFFGGQVEIDENWTIAQLLEHIGIDENAPWLIKHNGGLAERDTTLEDGDIVAVVPPVSGGCRSQLR